MDARLDRCSGPGEPPEARRPWVGGRWDTPNTRHQYELAGLFGHFGDWGIIQSCTRRETFGLARRLLVFLDDGFVVMMMAGADEYGDDGRYV